VLVVRRYFAIWGRVYRFIAPGGIGHHVANLDEWDFIDFGDICGFWGLLRMVLGERANLGHENMAYPCG
jgi:hypothetical protein